MDTKQWSNGEFNPTFGAAKSTIEAKPKPWPNEVQRAADFFWARTVARPTSETWTFRQPSLAEVQEIWDDAAAKVRAHEKRIAEMAQEREAKEQSQRDAAAKAFAEKQTAAAERREAELRAIHLQQGGTDETWEAEKADTLRADRQQRTINGQAPIGSLISPAEMLA